MGQRREILEEEEEEEEEGEEEEDVEEGEGPEGAARRLRGPRSASTLPSAISKSERAIVMLVFCSLKI